MRPFDSSSERPKSAVQKASTRRQREPFRTSGPCNFDANREGFSPCIAMEQRVKRILCHHTLPLIRNFQHSVCGSYPGGARLGLCQIVQDWLLSCISPIYSSLVFELLATNDFWFCSATEIMVLKRKPGH